MTPMTPALKLEPLRVQYVFSVQPCWEHGLVVWQEGHPALLRRGDATLIDVAGKEGFSISTAFVASFVWHEEVLRWEAAGDGFCIKSIKCLLLSGREAFS